MSATRRSILGPIGSLALVLAPLLAACGDEGGQGLVQVDTPTPPGLCPPGVELCSEEGLTGCVEGGLRTCRDVSGCLMWGEPLACPPNEACTDGACAPACPGATCDSPEARRCAPGSASRTERCADTDADGCFDWVSAGECDSGSVCSQGRCADTCIDECAGGFARCEGDGVVTCEDHDQDGCLEWGAASDCDGACAFGECVGSCVDECSSQGLTRCDGLGVETCRLVDGCLRWVASITCPSGTTCSAGRCSTACVDECGVGEVGCAGGRITCGQFDGDACRDWSLPVACPSGETCSAGACSTGCENECTTAGAKACDASGTAVVECGQGDADTCLELVEVERCDAEAGEVCAAGACASECVDECQTGERRCRPGSTTVIEVCGDSDADPCTEWGVATDCGASGEVCANGECAAQCADECQADACEGNAVVPCGNFDADACKDRGTPSGCAPTFACQTGGCVPRPPPVGVKIAEVLYRAVGPDEDVFIELGGPPATLLDGLELVAINGQDGSEYGRLAVRGSLDDGGRFVIAHPLADPFIADWADQVDAFADLQNGPDSLVLVWGDATVDALGYGDFTGNQVFRGEGEAALGSGDGESLARPGALIDTDDNLSDFEIVSSPTPGRPFALTVRPALEGDVIFNELMIDPKALNDNVGEWIELWNMHADQAFDLGGCVLESDPGESYTIPGSLVVPELGYIVIARTANVGFTPDHVWTGISLANDFDGLALVCDGAIIDLVGWDTTAPNGKSKSLDPELADAELNDYEEAWCPAPVDAAAGADAGTPGTANPPCAGIGGFYEATTLDSTWGSCDPAPNWLPFTFEGAPAATADATLDLEWWAVYCELFADGTTIEVEIKNGASYTPVGKRTFSSALQSCAWRPESLTVPQAVLNASRATTGRVEGRFRITAGCPAGVGCGLLGQVFPYNCARKMNLSYDY